MTGNRGNYVGTRKSRKYHGISVKRYDSDSMMKFEDSGLCQDLTGIDEGFLLVLNQDIFQQFPNFDKIAE